MWVELRFTSASVHLGGPVRKAIQAVLDCRQYHSWVLAMLLGQQNRVMHSVPVVAFKVVNFTHSGYSCAPDKVPVDRKLTFPVASNLYKDSEELLRNLHMAPYTKPIVSLIDDFPIYQRHKGWQFGYLINDTAKQVCPKSSDNAPTYRQFTVLLLTHRSIESSIITKALVPLLCHSSVSEKLGSSCQTATTSISLWHQTAAFLVHCDWR